MSAKILQVVNSSFFGLPRHVSSPAKAVVALGMETVRSLALTACVFAPFEETVSEKLSIETLWNHSMFTGILGRLIAAAEDADSKTTDHSFIAGMLHDAGKLALASMLPDDYLEVLARAREEGIGVADAEQEMIGATHAQLGAYLLELWGFDEPVIEALAFHHCPVASPNKAFCAATAVHVANVLAHECSQTCWGPSQSQVSGAALWPCFRVGR